MTPSKSFKDALNFRRSVRIYDAEKPLDKALVREAIQEATLAPNSSNMQLWEFYHITSPDKLAKMAPICLNQNTAKTAQQMVVVVVRKDLYRSRARFNKEALLQHFGKPVSELSKREKSSYNYYDKLMPFVYFDFLGIAGFFKKIMVLATGLFKPTFRQTSGSDIRVVAHKSVGLASQTLMLSLAAKGIDTCPMEGFDSLRLKRLLNLPYKAEINMVISCGYRTPKGIYGPRIRVPFEDVYTEV